MRCDAAPAVAGKRKYLREERPVLDLQDLTSFNLAQNIIRVLTKTLLLFFEGCSLSDKRILSTRGSGANDPENGAFCKHAIRVLFRNLQSHAVELHFVCQIICGNI